MKTNYKWLVLIAVLMVGGVETSAQIYEWGFDYQESTLTVSTKYTEKDGTSGTINTSTYKDYSTTYNGRQYTGAYKIETSSAVSFTTSAPAKIIIGVFLKYNSINYSTTSYISVGGKSYSLGVTENGTIPNTTTYKLITIPRLAPGTHDITRGDQEVGLFYIQVNYDDVADEEEVTNNALASGDTPQLWQSFDTHGMKLYLGGWKYQTDSALASHYMSTSGNYKNNSTDDNEKSDSWKSAGQDGNYITPSQGAPEDGSYYQCFFPEYKYRSWGEGDNARSEFVETGVPGKYDFNFKGFRNGNPFTVPSSGTFLKCEPELNGTVDLYIIQNGIVNLSASGNADPELQESSAWRPLYIVDELGRMLSDEGDDAVYVELPNKNTDNEGSDKEEPQEIYIGWDGSYDGVKPNVQPSVDDDYYQLIPRKRDYTDGNVAKFVNYVENNFKNSITEEQWQMLTGYTKDGQQVTGLDGAPYWTTGGTTMRMMPPRHSKDGWVCVNKTYVKYTFPVKAGKSYYVFMNASQIGFCGYEFTPKESELTQELTLNDDDTYSIKGGKSGKVSDGIPAGSYASVTLKRQFKAGWNAICLPFSVTESKMREAFGSGGNKEDYELVTYNGAAYIDNRLTAHFFRHAYQDIVAGIPYMIWIPESAAAIGDGDNSVTFKNITIEDDVERAAFTISRDYMDSSSSLYRIAEFDYFTFQGFYEPTEVTNGDYYVLSEGLMLYNGDTASTMKGFRSVLNLNCKNEVKEMVRLAGTNFTNILDELGDEHDATVINSLAEEMGLIPAPSNVYSLSGQLVRQNSTSLEGLPKGIYIVNGKKYFVN